MDIATLTEKLSETMRQGANVHAVFGEAMKLDTKTVIPVALVVAEGGGGFGEARLGRGAGGGLEVHALPYGFIAEGTDGTVRFTEIMDLDEALSVLAEQAQPRSPARPAKKGRLARARERIAHLTSSRGPSGGRREHQGD